jgi:hypothetical protein
MTREDGGPWSGDWRRRMALRLAQLGFASVRDFVAARPQLPFRKLTDELGQDIAAIQIQIVYLTECRDLDEVEQGAAECLARRIVEAFPKGWRRSIRADFGVATALANWKSGMLHSVEQKVLSEDDIEAIGDALTNDVRPPVGWVPESGRDPLIQRAFELGLAARSARRGTQFH